METLIDAAFARSRTVILLLVFILVSGTVTYIGIPKESDPDVAIPIIYVSMSHEGISPEDAERLLVRPMENELKSIEGIKEMRSTAREGQASVLLEFDAGFDSDKALNDVREKVDIAKTKLPSDTDDPSVHEVNVALFPILVVTLAGNVPERTLIKLARGLRDKMEAIPAILEVDIAGDREEVVDVIVDPLLMESYNLVYSDILMTVRRNNQIVAAGALDTGKGRFPVKVPGVFENVMDVMDLPVKVSGTKVVTFHDIAVGRKTFKDPDGYAHVGGKPALALEIKKRVGANIIETVESVRALVEAERALWPPGIKVGFQQDKSRDIRNMLKDLQNNVLSAVILVMIIIVGALGVRAGGLVGMAIPGSFLMGILVIAFLGYTVNIVVLFALILSVGMLVDGAIVVTEFADRKMAEGVHRKEAYRMAAKRMAWPITASTITTLAAFMPLLFWPGIVGEFMKYLPITLIATLAASLLMAMVFVPNLGAYVGGRGAYDEKALKTLAAAEAGNLEDLSGFTGWYVKQMRVLLKHPGKVVIFAMLVLVGVYAYYIRFGQGVEFFPDVEPEQAAIHVRARGDLSVDERDALVKEVESRILDMKEFAAVYSRSGMRFQSEEMPEDVIGSIQLELVDWQDRRPVAKIFREIRERTGDLAGIIIDLRKPDAGVPIGKPIQIELSTRNYALLEPAVMSIRKGFDEIGGFVDVEDSRPIPGIEWQMKIDRKQAGRFGADVSVLGNSIQLVTKGIKVGDYRPDDADGEVDIRVRFPYGKRSMEQMDTLKINTMKGMVPISNFVKRTAAQRVGTIHRTDSRRVMTVKADIPEGTLSSDKTMEIEKWFAQNPPDPRINVKFKGEDEEEKKAQAFLSKAFAVALFMMAVILVTQFNSFYQAFLILSAVVFSTVGVLIGLLIRGEPFGIVMSGVGVIALAGVVVNNNIVLIDTYNILRAQKMPVMEAILRTGAQRMRPVLLTTITTVLGLMPMVLAVNLDLISREITHGAPSTQWWTQLSTAVAGGLAFATMLTLVLSPCFLMLGAKTSEGFNGLRDKLAQWKAKSHAGA